MSINLILDTRTGDSWQVDDPVAWALAHADQPILGRARAGLLALTEADRDRVVRLVTRRCGLHFVEVRDAQVIVQYWVKPGDLRAFFKQHRLASKDIQVILSERKHEVFIVTKGDEFLYGVPLSASFPVQQYQARWEQRGIEQQDDWQPAPASWSSFFWEGIPQGRIPWAVLKAVWQRDETPDCANCDCRLLTNGFGWFFSFFNKYPRVWWFCPSCRRRFEDHTFWEVDERLVAVLDQRLHPQLQQKRHLIVPWTPPPGDP